MARPPRIRTPAIAYLRTSSAANVGADKGSDKRQRDAIAAYAKAVSGADPIETRPGFLALLDRIAQTVRSSAAMDEIRDDFDPKATLPTLRTLEGSW